MRIAALSVAVPLALVPLTGCIIIDADDIRLPEAPALDFDNEFDGDLEWNEARGTNGRVRGDIGPVRDFAGEDDEVEAYADASWTSVTIESYDDAGRMGMIIIEVERDIRDVPSGTYEFAADGSSDIGYVSVTGCSSTMSSDYDAPASGGVLVIDNDDNDDGEQSDDGDCDVAVEADMPDENGVTATASGSFTLET